MKLNVVPARTGLAWVRLGVRTFLRQPLALSGLFFMYTALVVVVSQLPVLGPLVGGLLVPAATLGLMGGFAVMMFLDTALGSGTNPQAIRNPCGSGLASR